MSTALMQDFERFCSKVRFINGGCIEWTAARDKKGYGVFRLGKSMMFAHRASYTFFVGPIAEGESVLHRCDNPACVNPKHLFAGTQADNVADMLKKGRNRKGSNHQNSKLTESDVQHVRSLLNLGFSQSVIAVAVGVSQTTISHIATKKVWRHV